MQTYDLEREESELDLETPTEYPKSFTSFLLPKGIPNHILVKAKLWLFQTRRRRGDPAYIDYARSRPQGGDAWKGTRIMGASQVFAFNGGRHPKTKEEMREAGTWHDVWRDILFDTFQGNYFTMLGNRDEEKVDKAATTWYRDHHPECVKLIPVHEGAFINEEEPMTHASTDGVKLALLKDGTVYPFNCEYKRPMSPTGYNGVIPFKYICQMQHQMGTYKTRILELAKATGLPLAPDWKLKTLFAAWNPEGGLVERHWVDFDPEFYQNQLDETKRNMEVLAVFMVLKNEGMLLENSLELKFEFRPEDDGFADFTIESSDDDA